MTRDNESFPPKLRSNAGPQQSILAVMFFIFGAVYWTPSNLSAFDGAVHGDITDRAFKAVPEAAKHADRWRANNIGLHYLLDISEGGESEQYKHSMRPAGTTLKVAEWAADIYVKAHVALAVAAAKLKRKGEAGGNLRRALHAVQDRKHWWCSCGSNSNPGDSDKPCSTDLDTGCPTPGDGNHGLRNCNLRGLEPNAWQNNFQLVTDRDPLEPQEKKALDASTAVLQDFLKALSEPSAP